MKDYIDVKLNDLFVKTYNDSVDDIIKTYDRLIKEFEDKHLKNEEDRNYFYKQLFVTITSYNDIILTEDVAIHLLKKLSKKSAKEYYMPIMDILMLTALSFDTKNNDIESVNYFKKAVKHSELYLEEAKKDYYNAYCCALGWLGVIAYKNGKYKECIKYNKRILELYDSVKSLEGFYYKEYDPKVVEDYINESKKRL